ncbi:hypothetical protein CBER1_11843 [Cercospora berteroae]|uniref:Cyanovirin-N domain-containing protein n=1 Tax=Cercospora berteroae TaxID=357750 RepID=A0A2S6C0J6_9PEZI|nr:hypothetical protein CBER1_11843 [Cercospora berteroae]
MRGVSLALAVAVVLQWAYGNVHKNCVVTTDDTGSVNTCMTKLACLCYKKNEPFFARNSPPGVKLTTKFSDGGHFTRGVCQGGYWHDPEKRTSWEPTYSLKGKQWEQCALSHEVRQLCENKQEVLPYVKARAVCDPQDL